MVHPRGRLGSVVILRFSWQENTTDEERFSSHTKSNILSFTASGDAAAAVAVATTTTDRARGHKNERKNSAESAYTTRHPVYFGTLGRRRREQKEILTTSLGKQTNGIVQGRMSEQTRKTPLRTATPEEENKLVHSNRSECYS